MTRYHFAVGAMLAARARGLYIAPGFYHLRTEKMCCLVGAVSLALSGTAHLQTYLLDSRSLLGASEPREPDELEPGFDGSKGTNYSQYRQVEGDLTATEFGAYMGMYAKAHHWDGSE